MANPHRILNVIDLQINGKPITHKEISSLALGGFERVSENSASGVFFKQSLRPFKIAFTVPIGEDTKIGDFEEMDNITLVLTADTGQSYAVSNAWVENADEISSGNLSVSISGNPAIEVK
ncbi:MAG: phage tail tube protein [Alphaproteobacteria bacterium]|nr:phage tail tube protein [Alphaproteobacteria bacterium]